MSTPEQHPGSAPPDSAPADSDPGAAAPDSSLPDPAAPGPDPSDPAAPPTPRRRTHPITPLVTGWKIVVGIVAVISAQNIARLVEDFTVTRALIGAGVLVAAIIVAIVLSGISWWFMTYAVDDDGVSLHTGMISKSREYAPRARIESVSVERPLLARVLGLAKVRVELAGGGESYLDIEYIRSADAEQLRRRILGIAALPGPAAEGARPSLGDAGADPEPGSGDGQTPQAVAQGQGQGQGAGTGTLENVLYDGVTDGELIAKIPTGRLVRSLLRDLGFLLGTIMSIVGVGVAIPLAIWQDGFSVAVVIALLPM